MINDLMVVDAVAIRLARYDLAIGLRFKQEFFTGGSWHGHADIISKLSEYWRQKFYHCASALFISAADQLPVTDDPMYWLGYFDVITECAATCIHWRTCHG